MRYKDPMRIIGLAGWSGSGKTTLITKLIPCLLARGVRVSTLMHAHHGFDLDKPGKDSFMHRAAGATEVIISSAKRWAILHELRAEEPEWDLGGLVAKCRRSIWCWSKASSATPFPSWRLPRANGKPLLIRQDRISSRSPATALPEVPLPVLDLNAISRSPICCLSARCRAHDPEVGSVSDKIMRK